MRAPLRIWTRPCVSSKIREKEDGIMASFCLVVVMARVSLYSACAGAPKIREKEDGIMAFFCVVVVMARVSLHSACAGAAKIREKEDGIMAFFLPSCGDGSCIIVL